MIEGDGRRLTPECSKCGQDDFDVRLDTVADEVFVVCPDCDETVIEASIFMASVAATTTFRDIDDLDPSMREMVEDAMDEK